MELNFPAFVRITYDFDCAMWKLVLLHILILCIFWEVMLYMCIYNLFNEGLGFVYKYLGSPTTFKRNADPNPHTSTHQQ